MEDRKQSAAAMELAADNHSDGWSGIEFDEVTPIRQPRRDRAPAGLSDEQMQKAGLLFGTIILGIVLLGVSLAQVFPEKNGVEILTCAQIPKNDERLSCYDKAAVSASAPFKGSAPFSTSSRSDFAGPG